MATHSSTLAWKIPWMEEPGRLQTMGSLRVRHDWVTSLPFSLSCTGEGNGNPLQCSCLQNPGEEGAWWAAIYGTTQSQTRLKWVSSRWSLLFMCINYANLPTDTELGGCSVAQLCLPLCDPMNCSSPGFSVRGILQARILEWVTTSSSRESSWPQGSSPPLLHLLHWQKGSLPTSATCKALQWM